MVIQPKLVLDDTMTTSSLSILLLSFYLRFSSICYGPPLLWNQALPSYASNISLGASHFTLPFVKHIMTSIVAHKQKQENATTIKY